LRGAQRDNRSIFAIAFGGLNGRDKGTGTKHLHYPWKGELERPNDRR